VTRFLSVRHPGRVPLGVVIARAQALPVGLSLAAVMIVTTAAVLQGVPVLRAFILLAPAAYAVAVAWSLYDLARTPAEVLVSGPMGAVLSVLDVARGRGRGVPALSPIFHPRKADGALLVGFGDAVTSFRREDWPEFDDLRETLEVAADLVQSEVRINGA